MTGRLGGFSGTFGLTEDEPLRQKGELRSKRGGPAAVGQEGQRELKGTGEEAGQQVGPSYRV